MNNSRAAEIIELLRARNERGLEMLYDHYSDALNGIAINIVGSQSLAEEVLQQSFLKIWNNIGQYDEHKSGLFTWMARITRNSAIDQRRLRSHDVAKKTETIDPAVHIKNTHTISTASLDVEKLIEGMNIDQQTALKMVYLQGYSHGQTADLLGIPLGTVKTRIRAAIKHLRQKTKKDKKFLLTLLLTVILLLS